MGVYHHLHGQTKSMPLIQSIMPLNKVLIQITPSFRAFASVRALRSAHAVSSHLDYFARCVDGNHFRHPRSIKTANIYGGAEFTAFSSNHSFTPKFHVPIRTNFSFAGPRKLDDIIKLDMVKDKSTAEISDMWMTYHEGKEKVHGLVLNGSKGKSVLSRAAQCPFFVHPVFREEGHFMIVSQFQTPNHFLLAFLEDYQMDPARAQPLLTISVFDDLVDSKDLALVRCDIINRGIEEDEGYKLCKYLINDYSENEEFESVHTFNKKPESFNLDVFIKEKEKRWVETNDSDGDSNVIETTSEEKK